MFKWYFQARPQLPGSGWLHLGVKTPVWISASSIYRRVQHLYDSINRTQELQSIWPRPVLGQIYLQRSGEGRVLHRSWCWWLCQTLQHLVVWNEASLDRSAGGATPFKVPPRVGRKTTIADNLAYPCFSLVDSWPIGRLGQLLSVWPPRLGLILALSLRQLLMVECQGW